MTNSLVIALQNIHDRNFGVAGTKIAKYQAKYKKEYDKKHGVKKFALRKGSPVQVKKHQSKRQKGSKNRLQWYPANSFYVVAKVDQQRKKVFLKNPQTGKTLKKTYHFDKVRKFQGANP